MKTESINAIAITDTEKKTEDFHFAMIKPKFPSIQSEEIQDAIIKCGFLVVSEARQLFKNEFLSVFQFWDLFFIVEMFIRESRSLVLAL